MQLIPTDLDDTSDTCSETSIAEDDDYLVSPLILFWGHTLIEFYVVACR